MHLDYSDFAAKPEAVGCDFDIVAFNFALFAEDLNPILRAAAQVARNGGSLVIQTVHPCAVQCDHYEDGWVEEKFDVFDGAWAPMPWFFRTSTSWLALLRPAGWILREIREPVNPRTGQPASLVIIASKLP